MHTYTVPEKSLIYVNDKVWYPLNYSWAEPHLWKFSTSSYMAKDPFIKGLWNILRIPEWTELIAFARTFYNAIYIPELCSNQVWFKYLMTQIFETNQNVVIWLVKWFELIWKWLHGIWFENTCWFDLWFLFSPQIRKTFLACNLLQ